MSPQSAPLWSPELYPLGMPPMWLRGSCCDRLTMWVVCRLGWPPVWWVARLCLVQRLLATDCQARSQGAGLVLPTGGGSWILGGVVAGPGFPDLVSACRWVSS